MLRFTFAVVALVACFSASFAPLYAQRIEVRIDEYAQRFEGAGSSIPLYLFNHFTLPAAGQAEALDLIVSDLNLGYLQDYPEFRPGPDHADYFDRRAEYFESARAIDPEVKISMTFSIFPEDLRNDTVIGNRTERRLDFRRAGIYDEVARWYFDVLDFYAARGITVDVVNAVNEPDFITQRYGFGTDSRRGTAELFDQAIGAMKSLIDDPSVNVNGVVQPLIMGPSTIAPSGATSFINYYKTNASAAWNNIDIVAYHQYTNGVSLSSLRGVVTAAEGKPVYQSEMHTNRGDNLPTLDALSTNHRGVLSLAQLFCTSVNTGAAAWFYFLNVFPTDDSNPGLLQIKNGFDRPIPFKHYYAFKQLTSAQPEGAFVVEHQLASLRPDDAIVSTFRLPGTDTVYVHAANFRSGARQIELSFLEENGTRTALIDAIETRITDRTRNDESTGWVPLPPDPPSVSVELPPYSLATYTVAINATVPVQESSPTDSRVLVEPSPGVLHVRTQDGSALGTLQLVGLDGRVLGTYHLTSSTSTLSLPNTAGQIASLTRRSAIGTSSQWVLLPY